ncbi:hypothetical protein SCHPADRAFT_924079 [Schizopora paradoxa]|uniref:Uncharacterized protein n=1 Tax=Schizopora paradoxa TaxID=27342 RepID=A0A0H2SEZ1_9AGAM|nr:hypothetical protein SCHPADRAFT_924079 [Schizopora paradoxa]
MAASPLARQRTLSKAIQAIRYWACYAVLASLSTHKYRRKLSMTSSPGSTMELNQCGDSATGEFSDSYKELRPEEVRKFEEEFLRPQTEAARRTGPLAVTPRDNPSSGASTSSFVNTGTMNVNITDDEFIRSELTSASNDENKQMGQNLERKINPSLEKADLASTLQNYDGNIEHTRQHRRISDTDGDGLDDEYYGPLC